jgi:hypothetical protein
MIDREYLQRIGFSSFSYPRKMCRSQREMLAWCNYIDGIGFLTLRLVSLDSGWKVDLVDIDYISEDVKDLEWIRSASIEQISKYVELVGTNRL